MKTKFNRIILVALAVVMVLSTGVMAATYPDVAKNHWAYEYINELTNKGIIQGYPDGTFRPDDSITFLETMELLKGLINPSATELTKAREQYNKVTTDTKVPEWANDAVVVALSRGFLTEAELRTAERGGMLVNNTDKKIDRLSVALYMAKAMELAPEANPTLKYKDNSAIMAADKGYLAALQTTGVLHPEGKDGSFAASDNIRRSEVAKMFKFAYDWVAKNPIGDQKEITGTLIHSFEAMGEKQLQVDTGKEVLSFRVDNTTEIKDAEKKDVKFEKLSDLTKNQVTVKYVTSGTTHLAKEIEIKIAEAKMDTVYRFIERSNTFYGDESIKVRDLENNKDLILKLDKNYRIYNEDNRTATIAELKEGQLLTLKLKDERVTEINMYKVTEGEYEITREPYRVQGQDQIDLKKKGDRTDSSFILVQGVKIRKIDRTPGRLEDLKVGDTVDIIVNPAKKTSIMAVDIGTSNYRKETSSIYKVIRIDNNQVNVEDRDGKYHVFDLYTDRVERLNTNSPDFIGSQRYTTLDGKNVRLEFDSRDRVTRISEFDGTLKDGRVTHVLHNFNNTEFKITVSSGYNTTYTGTFKGQLDRNIEGRDIQFLLDNKNNIVDFWVYR